MSRDEMAEEVLLKIYRSHVNVGKASPREYAPMQGGLCESPGGGDRLGSVNPPTGVDEQSQSDVGASQSRPPGFRTPRHHVHIELFSSGPVPSRPKVTIMHEGG